VWHDKSHLEGRADLPWEKKLTQIIAAMRDGLQELSHFAS
jgi:hypothetical protein